MYAKFKNLLKISQSYDILYPFQSHTKLFFYRIVSEAVINADNKMITVRSIGCIIWRYQIIKRPRHIISKQKSLEQVLGKRVGIII